MAKKTTAQRARKAKAAPAAEPEIIAVALSFENAISLRDYLLARPMAEVRGLVAVLEESPPIYKPESDNKA